MYPALCEKLGVPYSRPGALVLGFTQEDRATLERLLRQGEENHIAPLTEERALAALLDNTWRPGRGDALGALLGLLEQVVANTAIYEMRCTAAPEAAALSCRMMKGM